MILIVIIILIVKYTCTYPVECGVSRVVLSPSLDRLGVARRRRKSSLLSVFLVYNVCVALSIDNFLDFLTLCRYLVEL